MFVSKVFGGVMPLSAMLGGDLSKIAATADDSTKAPKAVASEIYARRRAERAAWGDEPEMPELQNDVRPSSSKALPTAAAVYAKRKAERAAIPREAEK